jgi:protein-tyrosine phosphatase
MFSLWRYNSRGYNLDPAAQIDNIIFGPGEYLTPKFADYYKITHVINCAGEEYSPSWFKEKFPEKYVCLNAIDSYTVNILDWYPKFKETMDLFSEGTVYVHCQAGINRSGFLVLAYLTKEKGHDIQLLERSMIRKRPCSLTNTRFREQVYAMHNIRQTNNTAVMKSPSLSEHK